MKYALIALVLSGCVAQVSHERMQAKYAEDRFRHAVYLEQEFYDDCAEYDMEECY